MSLKLTIKVVAFFLGHPVYELFHNSGSVIKLDDMTPETDLNISCMNWPSIVH